MIVGTNYTFSSNYYDYSPSVAIWWQELWANSKCMLLSDLAIVTGTFSCPTSSVVRHFGLNIMLQREIEGLDGIPRKNHSHILLMHFCSWYSQFNRAESRFLESSSTRDVLQNLIILNARIGTLTQTEHLPTCYTIRPLSWEGREITADESKRETDWYVWEVYHISLLITDAIIESLWRHPLHW